MTARIKGTLKELGEGVLVMLAMAAFTTTLMAIGYIAYQGFTRVCG